MKLVEQGFGLKSSVWALTTSVCRGPTVNVKAAEDRSSRCLPPEGCQEFTPNVHQGIKGLLNALPNAPDTQTLAYRVSIRRFDDHFPESQCDVFMGRPDVVAVRWLVYGCA